MKIHSIFPHPHADAKFALTPRKKKENIRLVQQVLEAL